MEWISVEDRLPLRDDEVFNYASVTVLAATKDNDVRVVEFCRGNTDKNNPWASFEEYVDGYITHWMPLPDPPKSKA